MKHSLSFPKVIGAVALISAFAPATAAAAPVYWTDWVSASAGNSGSASGIITLADSSTVNVAYSGGLYSAQISGGANYWSPNAYTSATVDNAPDSLNTDILRLGQGTPMNTITFSTPVTNPIMAVVSFNGPSWTFDAPFTVLSSGCGYWGCDTLNSGNGNILSSTHLGEGHGTLQFLGTFSSISWAENGAENWRGITVGVSDVSPVPVPAAAWLFGSALAGLGFIGKRRSDRVSV